MQVCGGQRVPDSANLETGPSGVLIVAIGGGHRRQQLTGPGQPGGPGYHGRDLYLGVEGDAGDLLPDQHRVVDPAPGLLPAPPAPARHGQAEGRSRRQKGRFPNLAVLHPQVALEGRQRPNAQHGHGHAVQLQRLGLVGVGRLPVLRDGPLVGADLVACDQSGPRERKSRRDTRRSPERRLDRAPTTASSGSEPGSSRSSSGRCAAARTPGRPPAGSGRRPVLSPLRLRDRPRAAPGGCGPGGSGLRAAA